MNALKKAETAKAAGEADADQSGAPAAAQTSIAAKRDLTKELGLDPSPRGRSRGSKSEPLLTPPAVSPIASAASSLTLELETEPALTVAAAIESPPSGKPAYSAPAAARARPPAESPQSLRNVFNAKKAPAGNSRKPFYVLVSVCLLVGAGYAAYIWQQMQPPSRVTLAARATPPSAAAPVQPAGPAGSIAGSPIPPVPADAANPKEPVTGAEVPDQVFNAGAGGTTNADRTVPPIEPPRRDTASLMQTGARDTPASRRDAARAEGGAAVGSPANLQITRSAAPAAVNPDIAAGYAALQNGDLESATQAYERALRADSASRDALLGIATIQLRLNRVEAAEAAFRRVLRLHPQDAYAAAQLAALHAGSDPVGALSQVNSLIARETDRADAGNGALPFIQGNQLAAQGRWNEAQQAYFNAHRADPNNPDYCYNLAVSLDRINESRLARDFYAKSLELARSRPAGFDTSRAQTRLAQLGGAAK